MLSLGHGDLESQRSTKESYERIPYRGSAWPGCRPPRLETIARLYGIDAASADHCRVLEIGCGDGANLTPLAVAHPDSDFVGLDLAEIHVARGRALTAELGLANLRFETGSFTDLEAGAGPFDYVIAHGLMSWVTPSLQMHLFDSCKRVLAPTGVAFISYNTWPGWSMRHVIRSMLQQHCRWIASIEERVARAREILAALVESVPPTEAGYREQIESVAAVASNPEREHYFAHEYLEDENHPFYVRDFVEQAASRGLRYLADAELVDAQLDALPVEQARPLHRVAHDAVDRMQVLDFALNRKFRQSLLCHAEQQPDAEPDLRRVAGCFVTSSLTPLAPDPEITGAGSLELSAGSGRSVEIDQPLVKAALMRFCEIGRQPIAFDSLLQWSYARIGAAAPTRETECEADRDLLCGVLGQLFLVDLVDLQTSPPCWALEAGERPTASPLVRLDAARSDRTTSLRHRSLRLDDANVREVLVRLDGRRDRGDLARELGALLTREQLDEIVRLAAAKALLLPPHRAG